MWTREELINILKNGTAVITFEKKDGTDRTMYCTLMENYLPKVDKDEDRGPRKLNEDNLSVWDIEAHGWRSFRVNFVKEVQGHAMA